jgi:ribosomal protein L1
VWRLPLFSQAIQNGDFDFDTVIATPDMMAQVGKVARILVSPQQIFASCFVSL